MEPAELDNDQFVTWLRDQLRRRQWNAADLARRLEIPPGTVSRWLSGERRPNPRSCDLLADVFSVDVDLVLTLAGHRPAAEPVKQEDKRGELIAMIKRVRLTPDRLAGLEGTLTAWLEIDRAARNSPSNGT